MVDAEDFQDVFLGKWQHLKTSQLITFAMTVWSLWQKWNLKLWEDKTETMEHVIGRAQGTLHAWQYARHTHTNDRTQQHHVQPLYWQPPLPNYFKGNIDVALFTTEKKVSMRVCLRDEKGTFVAAMTIYCEDVMTIAEGEAWGLYQDIQWISSLGYHRVIFELDCKMVVEDVHNSKINLFEYGSIIQNCRTLFDHYNDFVIVFTRSQANGSAHALARAALSLASRRTFDVILFCIAPIIMNETP
jgi:hypothetical protein